MDVRAEQPHDHHLVLEIHRRAFGDHGRVVADLVRGLRRDDPEALSLVAEEDGEVVGHVLFSRSLLDAPPRLVPVQVLSPPAVVPGRQRRGVGAASTVSASRRCAFPMPPSRSAAWPPTGPG